VTAFSAVFGAAINLIAKEHGDEIWLEGPALVDGQLYRWVFSDITPVSAHWRGYISSDEGKSWTLEEEIILRRKG
jgi:hypothetical protein